LPATIVWANYNTTIMKNIILVLILALILRIFALSSNPAGFTPDEAGHGYTAYSILKTGRDEWGAMLPIAPRAFGDFRAPLYTYLAIPSIFVFGLNEFAVRLPSVIFGTISVAVVYLLSLEFAKKLKIGKGFAVFSAFLLAISPWHVSLSRGAFEANLPVLLIPAAALFFIEAGRKKSYMVVSAILIGLGLFAYYSSRLLAIFIPVLLYFCFQKKEGVVNFFIKYKISIFVLLTLFLISFYSTFLGSFTRVSDISIIGENSWRSLSELRYSSVLLGMPDFLARIFNNKITYIIDLFTKNYLDYFSTRFLFTQGASEATYGMLPGIGLLYFIEIFFIFSAIVYIFAKKLYFSPVIVFVIALLLIAPIPAALSTGPGMAANRAAAVMPWIQILSGLGMYSIFNRFKNNLLRIGISAYFTFALIFFLANYFFKAPIENSRYMSYGWREAAKYIQSVSDNYENIIISKKFSEPQIFLAFYLAIPPEVVQSESIDWLRYESEGLKFVDQLGQYRLGKFIFRSLNPSTDLNLPNALLVGKPEEFVEITPEHIVYYPDKKPAIYFVSSNQFFARNP